MVALNMNFEAVWEIFPEVGCEREVHEYHMYEHDMGDDDIRSHHDNNLNDHFSNPLKSPHEMR